MWVSKIKPRCKQCLQTHNSNNIETVIKSLPTKRSPGPNEFIAEFFQTLKEKLIPILLKLFHKKKKRREIPPNSFYKASIILISQPDKDKTTTKCRLIQEQKLAPKYLVAKFKNTLRSYITTTVFYPRDARLIQYIHICE